MTRGDDADLSSTVDEHLKRANIVVVRGTTPIASPMEVRCNGNCANVTNSASSICYR
jgi:hypothetical protein